ncbi:unnamed protein product [Symbiodinium natans]|uniref:Uncharacterized protein n=1 Tax=Symbiodinium natans TaxID=878477 RepID=A0A812SLW8_9DINO|nr:unnamed protein product [Symbiodinium natans]
MLYMRGICGPEFGKVEAAEHFKKLVQAYEQLLPEAEARACEADKAKYRYILKAAVMAKKAEEERRARVAAPECQLREGTAQRVRPWDIPTEEASMWTWFTCCFTRSATLL